MRECGINVTRCAVISSYHPTIEQPAVLRSVLGVAQSFCVASKVKLICRLRNLWETYSANFPKNDRHGPSQIPTEIDLPHKTFGSQLVDDSPLERPDVLPFSTYAACRILDTNPEDMVRQAPLS